MKKISAILIICVMFASCKKLEDLNKNIKDPVSVSGESLFTGAQKTLVDAVVTPNVGSNTTRLFDQYWAETTYLDEENYNLNYRKGPDGFWNAIYVNVLNNLQQAKTVITATTYSNDLSPVTKQNKLAIVDVMSVYAWSLLVETFGNIPYSQALNASVYFPKYDDGLTIYTDLISRLNTDIATLNIAPTDMSFSSADNLYQGSAASWAKFANSLKLRMGMVLATISAPTSTVAALAKTTIESAAPNVFASNADNAFLIYSSSAPNTNPMFEDQVAASRHDYLPANTLVDAMNSLNDPRRQFYYTTVADTTIYVGVPYGSAAPVQNIYSQLYGSILYNPIFQGTIFEYSEVEFLLAEAVERGYNVGGTAESYYDNAIKASIEYWEGEGGASLSAADADAATYLAQPSVAYSTAAGTWQQKIGTQQWIAYYNRGFEGWTEWRRLHYPLLVPGPNALTPIPLRYTYPIEEQTLNGPNYQAAAAAIGGDAVTTKLFWDK